jgi:hypothetical protein
MKRFAMIAVLLGLVTTAWAGRKVSAWVSIDNNSRRASGNLGTVRNSADSLQYIGCLFHQYTSGYNSVYCYAQDSSGHYAGCTTTSTAMNQAVSGIGSDTALSFGWDTYGNCTDVQIENGSYMEPKQP